MSWQPAGPSDAPCLSLEAVPAGKTLDDVGRIVLATHRPGMTNRAPETTFAARFSFEHVLATALVHGHAGPDAMFGMTQTATRASFGQVSFGRWVIGT